MPDKLHSISFLLFLIIVSAFISCKKADPYPRPYGFHRIEVPQTIGYKEFNNGICPLRFEYPDFGTVSRDNPDSCWTDIYFEKYDCKWHLTYRNAKASGKSVNEHYEEYRRLVYKHAKKTTEIRESPFEVPAGKGTLFELYGNVAIPAQYFLSDANGNIALVSFYFNTALKNDSLAPVIDLMKEEMAHMRESFDWK